MYDVQPDGPMERRSWDEMFYCMHPSARCGREEVSDPGPAFEVRCRVVNFYIRYFTRAISDPGVSFYTHHSQIGSFDRADDLYEASGGFGSDLRKLEIHICVSSLSPSLPLPPLRAVKREDKRPTSCSQPCSFP